MTSLVLSPTPTPTPTFHFPVRLYIRWPVIPRPLLFPRCHRRRRVVVRRKPSYRLHPIAYSRSYTAAWHYILHYEFYEKERYICIRVQKADHSLTFQKILKFDD